MIISFNSYTVISIFAFHFVQLNFIGVVIFRKRYDFSVTPVTTMIKIDTIIPYSIVFFFIYANQGVSKNSRSAKMNTAM